MAESLQKTLVTFLCRGCQHQFKCEPGQVLDCPEDEYHPWRYFAACPKCDEEVGQAHWERSLLKAWANATGPRTVEGKAASAGNLEGYPNAETVQRSRFNAVKHGLYARTATYFPAKPGRYAQCEGCEYRYSTCFEQTACLKRSELFLKHHVAFSSRNPELLSELNADMQANVHALMMDMVLAIIGEGVQLKNPAYYYDKDGGIHWVEMTDAQGETHPIYEISANPLLKPLMEWLSKNGMTLNDLSMTPKIQEDVAIEMGHVVADQQSKEDLKELQLRQTKSIEGLRELMIQGREKMKRDPVLIEHQDNV